MKRVISFIILCAMLISSTLMLASCEAVAKAWSVALFEILNLGGQEDENEEIEDGGNEDDGCSDEIPEDGDGEPIVLDPGFRENVFGEDFIDELFGKDYTEVVRSWNMNDYDFLREANTVCVNNRQYERHERFTQYNRDEDGNVAEVLVSESRMASFYYDDEGNLRIYIDDTDEGEVDSIRYFDEALGKGYSVKHWTGNVGVFTLGDMENYHRLSTWDTLLSNLTDVDSYGYAEDGEYSYYHLVFTEYGRETVDYDIYYKLDGDYNTTAVYMTETIGTADSSYQSVRQQLYLPYSSYFDLPSGIYD